MVAGSSRAAELRARAAAAPPRNAPAAPCARTSAGSRARGGAAVGVIGGAAPLEALQQRPPARESFGPDGGGHGARPRGRAVPPRPGDHSAASGRGDHRGPTMCGGCGSSRSSAAARSRAPACSPRPSPSTRPEASVTALVLDATRRGPRLARALRAAAPGGRRDRRHRHARGDAEREELREACKPRLLRHMLAVAPGEVLLYLDADSLVCGPLDDLERLASEHGVLVRRRTRARAARRRAPSQRGRPARVGDARQRAVRARARPRPLGAARLVGGDAARSARCSTGRPPRSTASRCWATGRSSSPTTGLGASFFDLHDRAITAHEDTILIDGSPLRLMRFPGFEVDDPLALSVRADPDSRRRAPGARGAVRALRAAAARRGRGRGSPGPLRLRSAARRHAARPSPAHDLPPRGRGGRAAALAVHALGHGGALRLARRRRSGRAPRSASTACACWSATSTPSCARPTRTSTTTSRRAA